MSKYPQYDKVFKHGYLYVLFVSLLQLIGIDECLKRLHGMLEEAKQKAGLDSAVKLKALVSFEPDDWQFC